MEPKWRVKVLSPSGVLPQGIRPSTPSILSIPSTLKKEEYSPFFTREKERRFLSLKEKEK
jgi:hypothetical protein